MTLFIRLLDAENKAEAMAEAVASVREGRTHPRVFEVNPESFAQVPGSPFAYWVSESMRRLFAELPVFEEKGRNARMGLTTNNDFRFLHLWWECSEKNEELVAFAKGGSYSPFYADIFLTINWNSDGDELKAFSLTTPGTTHWSRNIRSPNFYFRPGLTWPIKNRFSFKPRALPANCIFAHVGPSAFVANDDPNTLLALQALMSSSIFTALVRVMAGWNFEVGIIQRTPLPEIPDAICQQLTAKARRAWSIQRQLDTTNETSHAFVLPALLRAKLGGWNPAALKAELQQIQAEIDVIAFDLYEFSPEDRSAVAGLNTAIPDAEIAEDDED